MTKPMTAEQYMSANLVTFTPEMDVLEAVEVLLERGIAGAPVVDKFGNLVGMLSEHDCLKDVLGAAYFEELGGQVKEFMQPQVKTVDADTDIVTIARLFIEGDYGRYPVLKDGRLVGQISRRDVLRALRALRGAS